MTAQTCVSMSAITMRRPGCVSLARQFHSTIAGPTLRRIVFILRLRRTESAARQAALDDAVHIRERRLDSLGPLARKLQVRDVAADTVGVSGDCELPVRV